MKESVEKDSLYLVFGKGSEGKRRALAEFDSLEDAKVFAKEHCGRHGVVVERTWDGDVEVWSSMKESVEAEKLTEGHGAGYTFVVSGVKLENTVITSMGEDNSCEFKADIVLGDYEWQAEHPYWFVSSEDTGKLKFSGSVEGFAEHLNSLNDYTEKDFIDDIESNDYIIEVRVGGGWVHVNLSNPLVITEDDIKPHYDNNYYTDVIFTEVNIESDDFAEINDVINYAIYGEEESEEEELEESKKLTESESEEVEENLEDEEELNSVDEELSEEEPEVEEEPEAEEDSEVEETEEVEEESVEEVEETETEEETTVEEDLMSLIADFLDKYDIEDSEDLTDVVNELNRDQFIAMNLFDISNADNIVLAAEPIEPTAVEEESSEEAVPEEVEEVEVPEEELVVEELSDEDFIETLFGGDNLVVEEELPSLEPVDSEEDVEEVEEEEELDEEEEDLIEKKLFARKRLLKEHQRNVRESEFRRMETFLDDEDEEIFDEDEIEDIFSEAKRYECPRPERIDDGEGISLADAFERERVKGQSFMTRNSAYRADKRANEAGFGGVGIDLYTIEDDSYEVPEECVGEECAEVAVEDTWAARRTPVKNNDYGYVITKSRRDLFEEELEEADAASREPKTAVANRALERRADLARIRRHTESVNSSERASRFREALNSSSRVQETASVESNSWAANRFIDKYNESKEFCFEDLLRNGFLG